MAGHTGPLVIVGGAEDKTGESRILRRFVQLGGGQHARVLVITVATELPVEVGTEYIETFGRIGVEDVRTFDVSTRDAANLDSAVKMIRNASCIYFTGGDQLRITKLLGGTRVDAALHAAHNEGIVLGGTSAGASMMSSTMIVEGVAETNPRVSIVDMAPGMEFLDGAVVDQHFAERGRLGRLLSAVAQYPHHLGLGIDENTAVIVKDHVLEVLGQGAVSIVDAGSVTYSNLDKVGKDESLALCGVKLHMLPEGCGFQLRERQPIADFSEWSHGKGKGLSS